jgi:hypothetical protein
MIMMNVKETLKKLHKRLPTLSLDELFELLDCYVEEFTLTKPDNQILWKEPSPWSNTVTFNTVKSDPTYNLTTSCTDGKIKYYDGGGSTQLKAEH